jgi:hypothetical protein
MMSILPVGYRGGGGSTLARGQSRLYRPTLGLRSDALAELGHVQHGERAQSGTRQIANNRLMGSRARRWGRRSRGGATWLSAEGSWARSAREGSRGSFAGFRQERLRPSGEMRSGGVRRACGVPCQPQSAFARSAPPHGFIRYLSQLRGEHAGKLSCTSLRHRRQALYLAGAAPISVVHWTPDLHSIDQQYRFTVGCHAVTMQVRYGDRYVATISRGVLSS